MAIGRNPLPTQLLREDSGLLLRWHPAQVAILITVPPERGMKNIAPCSLLPAACEFEHDDRDGTSDAYAGDPVEAGGSLPLSRRGDCLHDDIGNEVEVGGIRGVDR